MGLVYCFVVPKEVSKTSHLPASAPCPVASANAQSTIKGAGLCSIGCLVEFIVRHWFAVFATPAQALGPEAPVIAATYVRLATTGLLRVHTHVVFLISKYHAFLPSPSHGWARHGLMMKKRFASFGIEESRRLFSGGKAISFVNL